MWHISGGSCITTGDSPDFDPREIAEELGKPGQEHFIAMVFDVWIAQLWVPDQNDSGQTDHNSGMHFVSEEVGLQFALVRHWASYPDNPDYQRVYFGPDVSLRWQSAIRPFLEGSIGYTFADFGNVTAADPGTATFDTGITIFRWDTNFADTTLKINEVHPQGQDEPRANLTIKLLKDGEDLVPLRGSNVPIYLDNGVLAETVDSVWEEPGLGTFKPGYAQMANVAWAWPSASSASRPVPIDFYKDRQRDNEHTHP
jgi:hypothetical protein